MNTGVEAAKVRALRKQSCGLFLARSGQVFKRLFTGGGIHLNADRLSEGGFTYTGIHESVHFVKDVNPEGYKAIEKFVENYYKEKGVELEAEIKATQNLY